MTCDILCLQENRTKKIFFFLLLFFIATSLYAQISFENAQGVWNVIESLSFTVNEDFQPLRLTANGKTYLGWGSSIIIEERMRASYRVRKNGGYDNITGSYWSNNMLVLIVENTYAKTRGEIGITFIDKDTIFFTLVSGSVSTPFYFGKENIYIRARVIN